MKKTLADFLQKYNLAELDGSVWDFYIKQVGNIIFIEKPETDTYNVIELLVNSEICKSKGEVRRLIQGNGISVDNEKSTDINWAVDIKFEDWVDIKVGKKNYYRVFFV